MRVPWHHSDIRYKLLATHPVEIKCALIRCGLLDKGERFVSLSVFREMRTGAGMRETARSFTIPVHALRAAVGAGLRPR